MADRNRLSDRQTGHTITMKGRKSLKISGVEDVLSFDEDSIIMQTCMGTLSVDGDTLHIVSFNSPQNSENFSARQSQDSQGGETHRMSLYYDDSDGDADIPLQTGCIVIDGNINGLIYTDDEKLAERGGLFGLFRKR